VSDILWEPSKSRIDSCTLTAFMRATEQRWKRPLPDYQALYDFSISEIDKFWQSVAAFCDVRAEEWGEHAVVDAHKMPGARFFPEARLNYAENLLRRRDDGPAIIFRAEDKVRRTVSWRELSDAVSQLAQALKAMGVKPGDRCAGFVPNMPETIVAMLATTAVGGVWTSCSPDFGRQGVLDRFGQTGPKVLFTADGYFYNGKSHDSLARVADFLTDLPTVEQVVVLPLLSDAPEVGQVPNARTLADVTTEFQAGPVPYEHLPFNHPLYIMYSSGTTGVPKCIVHGAGGTLLQHLKEHQLHTDVRRDDRLFYFTTCGWMMWNWLASGLASEATLMLYDGSPFYPDGNVLFDFAAEDGITHFGTSAKYIDALAKADLKPGTTHALPAMRVMTSTGSPLAPEGFDYVYQSIKSDLQLSSISGGTDIVSCFVLGCPVLPVRRGEIQARGLGMAVEVFDQDGKPVVGEKGELVCTKPFPSMPIGFWNDPDGARYRAAYFERFPGVWCHGDFVTLTETGGTVIFGRSDATLNPGGVRIGTAEIYRQVEQFDQVQEAIVIGQDWENDTRVVLFVVLREGFSLDDDLTMAIKGRIRQNCTSRHVPAKIVQVADIPRTKSGKITELAVRDVVHGREIKNREALANPEALELFAGIPELGEA